MDDQETEKEKQAHIRGWYNGTTSVDRTMTSMVTLTLGLRRTKSTARSNITKTFAYRIALRNTRSGLITQDLVGIVRAPLWSGIGVLHCRSSSQVFGDVHREMERRYEFCREEENDNDSEETLRSSCQFL